MRHHAVFNFVMLISCLTGLLLMGCLGLGDKSAIFNKSSGVIYQVTEQEALDLAHWAMQEALPEQKIYQLSEPRVGLFVHELLRTGNLRYAHFQESTYIYEVDLLLAEGLNPQGDRVTGYNFSVKGSGDMKAGPDHLAKLEKALKEAFNRTGRAVAVTSVSEIKPGPPVISSPLPAAPAAVSVPAAQPPAATAMPAATAPESSTVTKAQPAPTGDVFEKLKKLKELFDQGIITREEFEAKKKELLSRI